MKKESVSWIILLILSIIWGSSFILMKKGMYTSDHKNIFSDTQVASIRMLLAGLVLVPFAIKGIRRIKTGTDFVLLAIVGLVGNFIPAFLFTYAETGVSSGYAGMLNSFTPIFAIAIGFVVFKNTLSRVQIIGVIIGTVGIILLALSGNDLSRTGSWNHIFAIILATFCYATSLNIIKNALRGYKSIEITSISFLLVLLPSIISVFWTDTIATFQTNKFALEGFVYIAILGIVGTAFAVLLFNKLISISSVLFASSVTYLIPVVAVLIGFAFNEIIGVFQICSMLVVLSGVFVANFVPRLIKTKP
jgi:drug/metabolite transporter (DMT)-like permease